MLGSIITFFVVLSILVFVHELGHFLTAKKVGIKVLEFGFGLPPRIWGKQVGETVYSINALPFGGFVRLYGEDESEVITEPQKAFGNKSKLARSIVVLAGVVMNFLLAILAFGIVYSFSGIPRTTNDVRILASVSGSPADAVGIEEGDIVRKVENVEISSTQAFIAEVEKNKGVQITLTIERDGQMKNIVITPRINPPGGEGPLGVAISTTQVYYPPVWQRPFLGVYYGFGDAVFWGKQVIFGFGNLATGLLHGQIPKDISGPVGIYAVTTEAARQGILALINFVGILSVNLAILNVLPFPALDGGRLLFIGIESVLGRKVLPKIEGYIHTVGMVVLVLFILAITARDIQRLITVGGSISQFLDSILK